MLTRDGRITEREMKLVMIMSLLDKRDAKIVREKTTWAALVEEAGRLKGGLRDQIAALELREQVLDTELSELHEREQDLTEACLLLSEEQDALKHQVVSR